MPPSSSKRKRPERQPSENDGRRPSPYRPERARVAAQSSPPPNTPSRPEREQSMPSDTQRPSSQGAPSEVEGQTQEQSSSQSESRHRIPYTFKYLTDEVVAGWSVETLQKVVAQSSELEDELLEDLLSEVLRAGLDARIPAQDAGAIIRDIISAGRHDDIEMRFLNLVSLLDDQDYGAALRALLTATGISPQIMRQELDVPLLMAVGLVRTTFEKMRTRKTTNALYRQANFNLLREESEGYAKLMSEYFNTAQEASAPAEQNLALADDAFKRVKALVGAFDLDVGRVLDITLDVSANLLVKAYPFFTHFYRASTWWPAQQVMDGVKWDSQGFGSDLSSITADHESVANLLEARIQRDIRFWDRVRGSGLTAFFDMDARRITNFESVKGVLSQEVLPELDARGKEANPDKRVRANEDRRYMLETQTLPPPGNSDAAQLLGFKLKFYASPNRDPSDVLPQNVVHLAALLIKIGFISLRDLYPHLYPPDEAMAQERTRLEREKAERDAKDRPGGGMNALAAAGALVDDTVPAPRTATKVDRERSGAATPATTTDDKKVVEEDPLPAPENQKIILLNALLLVGALPEALHILSRYPWIADVDERVAQSLQRIVKYMLSKMTDSTKPVPDRPDMHLPRDRLADTTLKVEDMLTFDPPVLRKPMRWLNNDAIDKTDGTSYRHYYNEWYDKLPCCQSLDDVFLLCSTLLTFLGPKIGQDVTAYGTLLRLAKLSLTTDDSKENLDRWLDLSKQLLVPALGLSKQNPDLAQMMFEILSFYPTSTRFNVYAEWFTGRTSRFPDVRSAFDRNKAEVRDVLRRVSRDTERRQGRALAKIAISSPGIVVMEMINQLESYSNMIPSLVECTKHFSLLAYDVLTWALINSLSGQGRDRIQPDGMLTSSWLQALSQFVASLFAKYAHVNPSPILQYLASELRAGNSTDLAVFEQILVEMAGIRSDVELNDNQVLAMGGGEHLQTHILQQLSDTRHLKKGTTAKRLIKGLAGPHLIGQTLIAIAQERQLYSYHGSSQFMPLKVLGNNLDKVQAVLAQYLEVLRTNLSPPQFEEFVPGTVSLIKDFGLEAGMALTICRIAIRHRMNEFDAAKKLKLAEPRTKVKSKPEPEANDDVMMLEEAAEQPESAANGGKDEPGEVLEQDEEQETVTAAVTDVKADEPWHPVLQTIIDNLGAADPGLATRVSIPFFVTFWTLDLQDVIHPQDLYEAETARLKSQINEITSDRSDTVAVQAKEREKRKRALQANLDKLSSEPRERLQLHQAIKLRIAGSTRKSEKTHWFSRTTTRAEIDARHLGLLQECFIPRAIVSPVDAHYAYQMLHIMHSAATPGFSLMHLCNQLFKKQLLASMIFQFTAIESSNFGRFLCDILKLLQKWHEKKEVYEQEAIQEKKKTFLSFVKTFDENGDPKSTIDFEEFRRMLSNFHVAINASLQACFESDEYMHIRNGIIVLKSIHKVFPAIAFMGKNMVDHVTALSQKDSRQDLKLAAMSLLGPLKNREKEWVIPQKFRNAAKDTAAHPAGQAQSDTSSTKLDATAAEFKPGATGPSKEDGEIDDEKNASAKAASISQAATASVATKNAPSRPVASVIEKPAARTDGLRSTVVPASQEDSTLARPAAIDKRQPARKGPLRSELQSQVVTNDNVPRGSRFNSRDDNYGRLNRPSDIKPTSRDQSPANRSRARSPAARDERTPVRPAALGDQRRQSHMSSSGRESPLSHSSVRAPLHPREAALNNARPAESPSQSDRAKQISSVVSGPPASVASKPPQRPLSSEVLPNAPSTQESQVHVNPARLAMINADVSNQNQPPKHGQPPQHNERDNRRDRDSRQNEHPLPSRAEPYQNERVPHDLPRPLPPPETNRPRPGRYDGPNGQESNHGRLNDSTESAMPNNRSGHAPIGPPRRNFTAPTNGRPSGFDSGSPASLPPKPAPSPAGPRGGPNRQGNPSRFDPPSQQGSNASSAAENGPSVHPSRMAQLEQPPAIQTSFNAPNGPRHGGSPTVSAPSGPRNQRNNVSTPTGPSPTTNGPPTGPASAADRQRKGDRQRASINATLQGSTPPAPAANSQGVSFRGASNRLPNSTTPNSKNSNRPGAPPTIASAIDFRPSQPAADSPSRPDLLNRNSHADRPRDSRDGGKDYRDNNPYDNNSNSSFPRSGSRDDDSDRRGPAGPLPPPAYGGRDDRGFNARSSSGPGAGSELRDRLPPPPRRDGGGGGGGGGGAGGQFNGPGREWNDRGDWREGDFGGMGDGRRGGPGGGGGPGGRGPMGDDGRGGPPRRDDGGAGGPDRRKRPHPADEGFDASKRRRSGK